MIELLKITSLTNAHIKELAKLYDNKERNKRGLVLVEGLHLVKEAYELGILSEVLIVNEEDALDGVTNILVTSDIIKKLSSTSTPQAILGVARIENKKLVYGNTILILDGVSDPGNFGTIVRTATALGVASIIVDGGIDIYNEKVVRATQGAIFKMPIVKMDLKEAILDLKKKGYLVLATSLRDAIDLEDIKEVNKYALILGNEAKGVSSDALALCDKAIKIKMDGDMESLNVAIAGAICLYSLNSKRK